MLTEFRLLISILWGTFFAALVIHLGVGFMDERRLVLQPVGHLTLFALVGWLASAIVAATVLGAGQRATRVWAAVALGLSILGLVILVTG